MGWGLEGSRVQTGATGYHCFVQQYFSSVSTTVSAASHRLRPLSTCGATRERQQPLKASEFREVTGWRSTCHSLCCLCRQTDVAEVLPPVACVERA